MNHPLLHLLLTQPGLLAVHAAGYADMLGQELGAASGAWRKRVLLVALGLCCAAVAVVLAGVAIMLWAMVPMATGAQTWLLIATPLVPAAGACWCWIAWRAQGRSTGFNTLIEQLKADMSIIRQTYPT